MTSDPDNDRSPLASYRETLAQRFYIMNGEAIPWSEADDRHRAYFYELADTAIPVRDTEYDQVLQMYERRTAEVRRLAEENASLRIIDGADCGRHRHVERLIERQALIDRQTRQMKTDEDLRADTIRQMQELQSFHADQYGALREQYSALLRGVTTALGFDSHDVVVLTQTLSYLMTSVEQARTVLRRATGYHLPPPEQRDPMVTTLDSDVREIHEILKSYDIDAHGEPVIDGQSLTSLVTPVPAAGSEGEQVTEDV